MAKTGDLAASTNRLAWTQTLTDRGGRGLEAYKYDQRDRDETSGEFTKARYKRKD